MRPHGRLELARDQATNVLGTVELGMADPDRRQMAAPFPAMQRAGGTGKNLLDVGYLDNRSGMPGSAGNSSDGPIAIAGRARRTHARKVLAPIRFFSSAGSGGGTGAPGRRRQRPVRCVQRYRGSGQQAAAGHQGSRVSQGD